MIRPIKWNFGKQAAVALRFMMVLHRTILNGIISLAVDFVYTIYPYARLLTDRQAALWLVAVPQLVTYKMITNDTTIRSKFFINYLDGQVTVNGALMDGQTYEMYAFATEHNTTRSAPE